MENAKQMAEKEGLDWIRMRGRFMEAYKKEAKQIVTKKTARVQGVKGRSKREGFYDLDEVPAKLKMIMEKYTMQKKVQEKANPKAYDAAKLDKETINHL